MRKFTFPAIVLLLVVISGCFKKPNYHLVLKNKSEREIIVLLKMGDFVHDFGIFSPEFNRNYFDVGKKHPIPETATLEWESVPDKKKFAKTVNVKSVVPSEYKEFYLYFLITDEDEVKVSCSEKFNPEEQ